MWIDGDTTLELQRNATLSFSAQIIDEVSNAPVDITGADISCAVANSPGTQVIVIPSSIVDDPVNGGFTIKFLGSAFGAVPGNMEKVELAYDIRIAIKGDVNVVMRGPFLLLPGVG